MWDVCYPVHSKVSTRIQCSQPEEDLDDQIESGGSICASEGKDTPKFSSQWQRFWKSSSLSYQSCLLYVLKLRLPKDPVEESLPASYTVPGSGSFEYPESNSAVHPLQDYLCPCWEFKVPTYNVYRGIYQGCNIRNCFLISLEVGEPVVAEPRHWSLEGCDRYIYKGLYVQRPTRAQIVDKVQWCLFIWRCCNIPGFPAYLVYANLKLQLDRSSDIGRFMEQTMMASADNSIVVTVRR